MRLSRLRIGNGILSAAMFLLPWQTVFLYRTISLPEGSTVYGNLGLYFSEVLILLALLFFRRPFFTPAYGFIVRAAYVFGASCFLSVTWSLSQAVSFGWVTHFVMGGILFFLLLDARVNIHKLRSAFFWGLVPVCVLGWMQYVTGASPDIVWLGLAAKDVFVAGVAVVETSLFRVMRAYGSFPHPNVFGGYLVSALFLLLFCDRGSFEKKSTRKDWQTIFFLIVFSSTLILTFSRSAWIALTVSGGLFLITSFIHRSIFPKRMFQYVALLSVVVMLMVMSQRAQVFARFDPTLRVETISIEERTSQYVSFLPVFLQRPLFGVGPGGYVFALEAISPGQPSWSYQPIHNTFLLLLAELGIVGVLAFFHLFFVIGKFIWKEQKGEHWISLMVLGVLFFVLGFFDHYLFSLWPGFVLGVLLFGMFLRSSLDE